MSDLKKIMNSILSETTRQEREQMVEQIIQSIHEGLFDPREVQLHVKYAQDFCSMILDNKEYKEALINESQKHGKEHTFRGATFAVKESGVKWDFSVCNDPVLQALTEKEKIIKEKIKQREEYLKSIPDAGKKIMKASTGEVVELNKPVKRSTTTVAVTLSK